MKTIIFSDTHLGSKFIPKKFNYLKKIISSADQVIINGDFWDDIVSIKKFTESKWKNLFPLLKAKKTIYIYGNHDEELHWNEVIKQFSTKQTYEYKIKTKKYTFIITHGHKITPTLQSRYFGKEYEKTLPRVFWKFIKIIHKIIYNIYYHTSFDMLGSILFKEEYYKPFKYQNEKMKKYAKTFLKDDEILICGHSHRCELDLKNKFANDGLINHGIAQYIVIKDDKIRLVKERY